MSTTFKIIIAIIIVAVFILIGIGASKKAQAPNSMSTSQVGTDTVVMTTSMGDIILELFGNEAPTTVENFINLINDDFYNGTRFHRVIKDFMIQGGDPQSKDITLASKWGTGGPGYKFDDEIYKGNHNGIGTIAMANSGPNTNGSQFFINVAENDYLDTKHTVFGRVIEGMDIVMNISNAETGINDRPANDIVIKKIVIK